MKRTEIEALKDKIQNSIGVLVQDSDDLKDEYHQMIDDIDDLCETLEKLNTMEADDD